MKKLLFTLLLLPTLAMASSNTIILTDQNQASLNDSFNPSSVTRTIEQLKKLDSIKGFENKPIYLVINSGGGYISSGLELIEFAKGLKRPVHTISHFAASMAFETVNQLGNRLAFESSILMSHKARGMAYGEYPGQLDNRLKVNKREVELMEKAVVIRTKGKHSLKSYRSLIENEYWCVSEDCIKQGFLDETIHARCDSSLSKTHTISEAFFSNGAMIKLEYTYSNCAMQTAPLKFVAYVNGENVFEDNALKYMEKNVALSKFILNKKDIKLNHIKYALGTKK